MNGECYDYLFFQKCIKRRCKKKSRRRRKMERRKRKSRMKNRTSSREEEEQEEEYVSRYCGFQCFAVCVRCLICTRIYLHVTTDASNTKIYFS